MTEQETNQPQEGGLSLNDIANALQIIDIAVGRGAIRGEEASSVGQVRDRLAAFLKAAQSQQAASVDEAGEVPVAETVDEPAE